MLACSCLTGVVLLASHTTGSNAHKASIAELDSLIQDELDIFNIRSDQVTQRTVEVDSLFSRKIVDVGIPLGLSRTFIHTELAKRISKAGWESRGRVEFPERDITMEVISENTLVRTIHLRRDTTSRRLISPASVLVYFDDSPGVDDINRLQSLGEPIGILLRGENPNRLKSRYESLEGYPHLIGFWPAEETEVTTDVTGGFISELRSVQRRPVLFSLSPADQSAGGDATPVNWIIAEQAVMAGEEHGRQAFNRDMRAFSRRAVRGERPVLLMKGTSETLRWLEDAIYDFKKGGLVLTPPPISDG